MTKCYLPAAFLALVSILDLSATGRLASADELASNGVSRRLPAALPAEVGMTAERLARIDNVVQQAIEQHKMPGCVVAIGHRGKLVYLKAYGNRQLEPRKVPMTTDTVFDMASLTKPLATATSVMQLVEAGAVRLADRVAEYLPEFGQQGKDRITIYHLLTHQSGLLPDNALSDYEDGPERAWERICSLELRAEPGEKFIYSDVGYIVLGELVRRVSGETLDEYTQERIYRPLGMLETGYLPSPALCERAAVTEQRDGHWMQGEVHDPRAYLLGKVAGHAGLFSTAEDLALYAQMMLQHGQGNGRQILAWRTVDVMTADYPVNSGIRGLGWDKRSGYSSNRGELFTDQAFGHGGFTGTALWIDPGLDLFVIFLSNRVHPDGRGSVNPLAGAIGTIAASAIEDCSLVKRIVRRPHPRRTLCGIDVLQRDGFRLLAGKRVGLITNQTGITVDGVPTGKLLQDAPNVQLVALFSPEHGLQGQLDQPTVEDGNDLATGLKVYSLYGATRRPTLESLHDIDTLVFDIQDIGTRFYTYISTMGNAMEAAAEQQVQFVVLDRPNPINGIQVSGPVLDEGRESFVGFHTIPVRHGMTVGELAGLLRHERKLNLDLTVVPVEGWRRADYLDQTGLTWVNPSPNMRNLNEALLYPGIGLLEMTNLSVGRGTDTPFEVIGAPWLDGRRLARELAGAELAGVGFVPVHFTPDASKFAGEVCGGVSILITDRRQFDPVPVGWEIARQLRLLYPEKWDVAAYDSLLGDAKTLEAVKSGAPRGDIMAGYQEELDQFLVRRAAWLLYD